MINKDELIFAVDENNHPVEPVGRQKAHAEGIWHRTTNIAVVNSKYEILCHKRSMLKDTGQGLWDSCFGGHISPGMEALQGAIQELKEETGLEVAAEDLKLKKVIKYVSEKGNNKEFRYFYIYNWDGDVRDLEIEKDEVEEVKWISAEILTSNRTNKELWSPMPYFDEIINNL